MGLYTLGLCAICSFCQLLRHHKLLGSSMRASSDSIAATAMLVPRSEEALEVTSARHCCHRIERFKAMWVTYLSTGRGDRCNPSRTAPFRPAP